SQFSVPAAWLPIPLSRTSKPWSASELSAADKVSSPSSTPATAVSVTAVASKRDLEEFIRLPWRLYHGDPNWVPPLLRLQRELFSQKPNPFFQHPDVPLFRVRRVVP